LGQRGEATLNPSRHLSMDEASSEAGQWPRTVAKKRLSWYTQSFEPISLSSGSSQWYH